MELTADGLSTQEAAKTLFLGAETVKTYKRKILMIMRAKNMTQAVAIAIRDGLIK